MRDFRAGAPRSEGTPSEFRISRASTRSNEYLGLKRNFETHEQVAISRIVVAVVAIDLVAILSEQLGCHLQTLETTIGDVVASVCHTIPQFIDLFPYGLRLCRKYRGRGVMWSLRVEGRLRVGSRVTEGTTSM